MSTAIAGKALQPDRGLRFQSATGVLRVLEILARRNGWPLGVDALKPLLGA